MFRSNSNFHIAALFLLITLLVCAAVWSVEQFVNQDGAPHLYNAYLMLELIHGNSFFADIYKLNSPVIPNSSGHWLLAALLLLCAPATVTKLFVSLSFAATVAAIGWLHWRAANRENLTTGILLGAALAFNWLWFLGFYNFTLGTIVYAITLGWWLRKSEQFSWRRVALLATLFVIGYFSHLIAFGAMVGALLWLTFFGDTKFIKQNLLTIFLALAPIVPLGVGYKLLTDSGGGLVPTWRSLENGFSIVNLGLQLQTADPFVLLTRRSLPFLDFYSKGYAVFSPSLWFAVALALLSLNCLARWRRNELPKKFVGLILLGAITLAIWVFAPDDFGKAHGGYLRERALILGLIAATPVLAAMQTKLIKNIVTLILLFVVCFQSLVVWEYALYSDKIAREYLTALPEIQRLQPTSLGSIVIADTGCRFAAIPLCNLNPLLGVGNDVIVRDNYELGFYLFPVVTKNVAEQRFVYKYGECKCLAVCNPNENTAEKLTELAEVLKQDHEKLQVMLVWGTDEQIDRLLIENYEAQPFFRNQRVRLFKHK